jgi:predicted Fe-Mo cluster-binding NifX family protein
MNTSDFKVAVVTDDGTTISRHFGSSRSYRVLSVSEGKIVNTETREKFSPHASGQNHLREMDNHAQGAEHHHEHLGAADGLSHEEKHHNMINTISDCKYCISQGMGYGIYQAMELKGLVPIVTDINGIEESVEALIAGTLINHSEKLH